jgi:membrane dipeptidase
VPVSAQPWVDLHAHPGRCFLAGLGGDDSLVRLLGSAEIGAGVAAAAAAGLAAITLSTVADLRVLVPDPVKGLTAGRAFGPGEAYRDHRRQLDAITTTLAGLGVPVAKSAAQVEEAQAAGTVAVLLSCEGGDFLDGRLEPLAAARAAGASSLTLVHYRVNEIGDVQTEEPVHGGLTGYGREVVAECNRLGLIVDCAHATFETTLGVLAASSQPVMVSHSHLGDGAGLHPRLLSRDHALVVAAAGGLIGAWPAGVVSTSLADFAGEVARLTELVGPRHVAIGTDLDANYRPVLRSYADFALLPGLLGKRGFSQADIDQVLGGNALRLLRDVTG